MTAVNLLLNWRSEGGKLLNVRSFIILWLAKGLTSLKKNKTVLLTFLVKKEYSKNPRVRTYIFQG